MEKKSRLSVRILKFFGILILGVVALPALWCLFSFLDRARPLNVFPKNYRAFVHVDSLYDGVNPILDLEAMDTVLAEKEFSQARAAFMSVRGISARNNPFVKRILSRKMNAALYMEGDNPEFIATLDLGWMSCVTRLSNFLFRFLDADSLSLVYENSGSRILNSYYLFSSDGNSIYIKPYKNLVVVSNSRELFHRGFGGYRENSYSRDEAALLAKKTEYPVRIVLDSKEFASYFLKENEMLSRMPLMIQEGKGTVLHFGISDGEISVRAEIPVQSDSSGFEAASLFARKSRIPATPMKLPENVQYYTLLNLGSLSELKDALFPVVQKNKDIDSMWKTADSMCRKILSLSIDDIAFSWTGDEFAAFGIEGASDPIFMLKIKDEKKRREIFEKLESSIFIRNDTNLILGGVRISCIGLPNFLNSILDIFGINLATAYYYIQDGFIYFSLSPQNLSKIYSQNKEGKRISHSENWKLASDKMKPENSVSLYYNLERSVPFFMNSRTLAGKILRLYNIGRLDLKISDGLLTTTLHGVSIKKQETEMYHGFPVKCEGRSNFRLMMACDKKHVAWIENERTLCAMNLDSLEVRRIQFDEKISIALPEKKTPSDGILYALDKAGNVYAYTEKFEPCKDFPIATGFPPETNCAASSKILAYASSSEFVFVKPDGEMKIIPFTEENSNFKSCSILGEESAAFYSRAFDGFVQTVSARDSDKPQTLPIDGIGFGSPCVSVSGKTERISFVTQAGLFYLYENGRLRENFPIQLDGVFYADVASSGENFYALSEKAVLYRISPGGRFVAVALPDVESAKDGVVCADASEGLVFASGDSNLLYAFNSDMELDYRFPVAGRGGAVCADINKDGKTDCMALSVDKNLYAWDLK